MIAGSTEAPSIVSGALNKGAGCGARISPHPPVALRTRMLTPIARLVVTSTTRCEERAYVADSSYTPVSVPARDGESRLQVLHKGLWVVQLCGWRESANRLGGPDAGLACGKRFGWRNARCSYRVDSPGGTRCAHVPGAAVVQACPGARGTSAPAPLSCIVFVRPRAFVQLTVSLQRFALARR